MNRPQFSFKDIAEECAIEYDYLTLKHSNGVRQFGAKISVKPDQFNNFPYNASAYDFLQFLRQEIYEFGVIEIPGLPINKQNYTVAMKAPAQHSYSSNPYLTEPCQSPHQDTPPYPTAFWLPSERLISATWLLSDLGAQRFHHYRQRHREQSIEKAHEVLVPQTIEAQEGLLVNYQPGLILIDNSQHHQLYHAKTQRFENIKMGISIETDTPMYSFNEQGLLNYMDSLDEQRGPANKNQQEAFAVAEFLQRELKN